MSKQKVGIVVECVCDLPRSYIREHNIDVIYFLITTDSGVFTASEEITSENVFEYIKAGGSVLISSPPEADVYERYFRKNLAEYDEVIFISSGAGTSTSYSFAEKAYANMGADCKNLYIFDSMQISTGTGHIIMEAVELAESGLSAAEILPKLEELRERVCSSFIMESIEHLYRGGRVSENLHKLCDTFGLHPVMKTNGGYLTLGSMFIGSYEKASLRYVRRELRNAKNISKKRIFITHSGCSKEMLEHIKAEVRRICHPDELLVTKASASISCNCGPDTFGVFFIRERKHSK